MVSQYEPALTSMSTVKFVWPESDSALKRYQISASGLQLHCEILKTELKDEQHVNSRVHLNDKRLKTQEVGADTLSGNKINILINRVNYLPVIILKLG